MRILHSSDWHLGARLGNQDRLPDQLARIEEICRYIDDKEVDVLLVAGDVFDEYRAEPLARIISRLARFLTPRIQQGLTCVFIAGNHDREHVFPLLSGLQDLVSPDQRRVIFAQRPALEQVTTRAGETVNLMLLPYPTPSRYDLSDQRWPSPDTKRDGLHQELRARIRELSAELKSEGSGYQTVVCGHFWIRGVTEGLYRVTEQDDILLDPSDVPAYAYTALGHIHKPQHVGAPYVRYCGSIERMDRGEKDDQKQVLLAEVTKGGLQGVEALPLDATPFAHIEGSSEAELEERAAAVLEPDRTLVSVTARLQRQQSLGPIMACAKRLFPRLYGPVEVVWEGEEEAGRPALEIDRHDVSRAVRAYLNHVLKDDPDAEAITAAAEELLEETGVAQK